MRAFRVWFKDASAVCVNAEDATIAKGKAQEIADRNQGIMPTDQSERRRWRAAKTISKVESLT